MISINDYFNCKSYPDISMIYQSTSIQQNKYYLPKFIVVKKDPPEKTIKLEHLIEIKSKQTKGSEGEKAKA